MLSCCHCLCMKEYDAMTRVAACYPTDGRPDPVAARVRELVNWGIHDISRFSSIHEIIAERIRHDIVGEKVNSAAVGVAILGKLLASVTEINMNLSSSLTTSVILLIRTRKGEFLDIADAGVASLLASANRVGLSQPIRDIISEYAALLGTGCSDRACQSLARMLEGTPTEYVPVDSLLSGLRDLILSSSSGRSVAVALAHSASPLSLPRFSEQLFHFFDESGLWEDSDYLHSLMVILLSEMKESCSPPFLRLWLEQLPPKAEDNRHCRTIVSVAARLAEELPPEKLLSSSQSDSLLILFLFILKLPSLGYADSREISDCAFGLSHTIAAHFAESDLARLAHHQIWETLPTEDSRTVYSEEQIALIFRFIANFNDGIAKVLTSKMVNEGLNKVLAFLVAFKRHPDGVYREILAYLKKLNSLLESASVECIIPFLLALQSEVVKKKMKMKYELPLHTFVLCAMIDVVKKGHPKLKEYVAGVAGQRLKAQPPMIEPFSFIGSYFPKFKAAKKAKLPGSVALLQKADVVGGIDKRKAFHSIDRNISFIAKSTFALDDDDDFDDFDDDDGYVASDKIPVLVYEQGEFSGDDNDSASAGDDTRPPKEKKRACTKAVNSLLQIELNDNSIICTLQEDNK